MNLNALLCQEFDITPNFSNFIFDHFLEGSFAKEFGNPKRGCLNFNAIENVQKNAATLDSSLSDLESKVKNLGYSFEVSEDQGLVNKDGKLVFQMNISSDQINLDLSENLVAYLCDQRSPFYQETYLQKLKSKILLEQFLLTV